MPQGLSDALPGRLDPRSGFLDEVQHRAARRTHPTEAFENVSGAPGGNHVVMVQVHGEGLQARPVLHCGLERFREFGLVPPAARTAGEPGTMPGDLQLHPGQLEHLASLETMRLGDPAASVTVGGRFVVDDVIGRVRTFEMMSRMS